MSQFKQSEITRAIAMYNALHGAEMQYEQAFSFLSCLDMVLEQEEAKRKAAAMIPVIEAGGGEDLLNAVGRAVMVMKPVNLMFDGKEIHIDPAMTLADAFAHAQYVLNLNDRYPVGGQQLAPVAAPVEKIIIPSDAAARFQAEMAQTFEEPEPVELTPHQQDAMEQIIKAPQLGRGLRMMQGRTVTTLELDHAPTMAQVMKEKNLPGYVRMTDGPVHQQQRDETLENVIERLMPLAPIRVRISGLVMTLQDGYTTAEMIEEAQRRIVNRINDEDTSGFKRLDLAEEELSDGTLRTSARVWRKGYRYRLDVMPNNQTEFAEYHIHMKERPTQRYMDPHIQLMYDKKARVFLNITNGFDRFENITHFYSTAAGRKATAELAQIEKQIHDEFVAKGGDYYPTSGQIIKNIERRNSEAKGPFYSESWEDPDCGYRVKYWDTTEGKWRYTYFPTQPNGMATQIRNVKGHPASIEFKKDFTTAPK